MKITAIILAAGSATRMKQNKLKLEIGGERILDRVAAAVQAAGFHEVLLVVNEAWPAAYPGIRTVVNPEASEGAASSIRWGVSSSSEDTSGYAFIMGDQPFLTTATLAALIQEFKENPLNILQPRYQGKSGSPVIFPAFLKPELLRLTGDTGGRAVIKAHPELLRLVDFEDEGELMDIDTMADYDKAALGRKTCLIRGGGDLATGVAHALFERGYRVLITETARPSCIRTEVAFASAVLKGSHTVAGVTAVLIQHPKDRFALWQDSKIPVLLDEQLDCLREVKPDILVDGILAKKNLGTAKSMADLVICLGPGFTAPEDCHAVIETMRGDHLGDIITQGAALPNTGVPGLINGFARERVIHSPADGTIQHLKHIGDIVGAGEPIALVGNTPVQTKISGLLRGLIYEGYPVTTGLKIADVDSRLDRSLAFTISDKAALLGQAVLQAIQQLNG